MPAASIVSRNPSLSHTAALVEIIPHHHEYTILKTNQSRKKVYLFTAENSPNKCTVYSGFRKVCQRLQCPEISESGQLQHHTETEARVVGFDLFMRLDINNKNCEESRIIP